MNILEEANEVVHGDRHREYGTPFDNHTLTAAYWSTYFGEIFTPEDVCFMNILQKISRADNMLTRDTLVDIAGYAGNVEMIQDERERQQEKDSPTQSAVWVPTTVEGLNV